MSTEYINISSDALEALYKNSVTEYDRKVYMTLCKHATFKHKVFGVYKRYSFHTLRSSVLALTNDDRQVVHLRRSIKRLETAKLIKVLSLKDELIISFDINATLDIILKSIEQNIDDFNIHADRIAELEKHLKTKLNINRKKSIAELNEGENDIPADF